MRKPLPGKLYMRCCIIFLWRQGYRSKSMLSLWSCVGS
uniref:Uncharacterized protein n=1 Tax=Rhizophora mucronata TaxID=61149 RepID=A0A2P2QNN1_RHIMU